MRKLLSVLVACLAAVSFAEPTYGPFSAEEQTEAFAQRMHDCTPTMVKAMTVTIDGEAAKEGDSFGAYVVGTDAFCGDGKAFDGSGKMSGVLYVPSGTKVTFRIWRSSSGLTDPEILTSDASSTLTVAEAGKSVTGHAVVVKTSGDEEDPPDEPDPPTPTEPTYGPFSAEEQTEAFAQRMHDCTPTMVKAMTVTIDGEAAKEGDSFGAYVVGTDAFCGDGKAFDGSGKMSGVLYVPSGTKVTFRIWRSSSGLTNPEILTSDASDALTVAEAGKSVTGHAVTVKTSGGEEDPPDEPDPPTPPTPTVYAITYILDGGVNAAANPTSYTTNDLPIKLAAPTREGYDFAGWTPSGVIAAGTTGELTFTAKWKSNAKTVEVPFDDLEELAKGVYVKGPDHTLVVNGIGQPKIAVKGLPLGLKFDAKSNWIAGTPTKSGVYAVTVTVTDATNKSLQPLVETLRLVVRGSGEHVVIVDNDETQGTAKGAGVYDSGKKVTLKAAAKKGFVFTGWYLNGARVAQTASYTDVMGSEDRRYEARYITLAEDAQGIGLELHGMDFEAGNRPSVQVMCGVALSWPVEVRAMSQPTVKVSGLPSGLKFTAKDILKKGSKTEVDVPANTIYGAPTKEASGIVKVTVTTAGKSKREYQFLLTVEPLPAWAVGTFDGVSVINDSYGDAYGSCSMTVAASGKASGKMSGLLWQKKVTASGTSASFSSYENGVFYADMTFKIGSLSTVGRVKLEAVDATVGDGSLTLGRLSVDDEIVPVGFDLLQNPWLRKDGVAAPRIPNDVICQLLDKDSSTDLYFTLKDKGVVKAAGTLNGKKFSGTSQLLLLEGTVDGVDYNGVFALEGAIAYLQLTYQGDAIVDFDIVP